MTDKPYQPTYSRKLTKQDGRIDWTHSTVEIFNLIRAVTDPYPGAFTETGGARLMVWWAESVADQSGKPGEILSSDPLIIATGDGALHLTRTEWLGSPTPALAVGSLI